MMILISLILLISVAASEGASLQGEWVSPSITYWHQKLPTTAIPETLREFISDDAEKLRMVVGKGGVNVNTGMLAPKDKTYTYAAEVQNMAAPKDNAYTYAADAQMPMADPSFLMFLPEKDLHNGTKTSLRLVQENSPSVQKTHFLPRAVADKIPFSSDKIPEALKELNIEQDSDTALAMKEALEECETPAVRGESKYCATSLESMIDYVTSRLGSNRVTMLETNVPKTSKLGKQEYSIEGVKYVSKAGEKLVACHSQKYPYVVYYCHETQGTRTARVQVTGKDGSKADVLVVCHGDTSAWNPNYMAFKLLNAKPGASICHFLPQAHIVWQPTN